MNLIDIFDTQIKPKINYEKELSELEPRKKSPKQYQLICPNCNKKEAFLYTNTGLITCNRKNNCQYQQPFLAYKNGGNYPRGQQYVDVVKQLAQDYGVPIEEKAYTQHMETVKRKATDQEILSKLWNYFIDRLPKTLGASYLVGRNFPIDKRQFGYYPQVQELKDWIGKNGIDLKRCEELGLIRGDFSDCIIGVWRAQDGDICNFWARALDDKDPKYNRLKNYPELKQNYPQGSETVKGSRTIWVEGHLDVIAASLSELSGVVGCGTSSIPDNAFSALKTREIVLCLDNDEAGRDGMFRFIEKHKNDDGLRIFVAPIAQEGCADLADVYSKQGKAGVQEVFNPQNLQHYLTFAADYISRKHKGNEDWSEYSKTQALEELSKFSEKIPAKERWAETEYFWPEVTQLLKLEAEDIASIAESMQKKKDKEEIFQLSKTQMKEAEAAFSSGEHDRGKEIIHGLNQELQSISAETTDLNDLLKASSEEEVFEELSDGLESIYTGYDINEDIKLELPAGAISIVAAPTGHGKTRALINFSLGALEQHPDKAVYFFTYEESWAAITTLFLNTYIEADLSGNNRRSIKHYYKHAQTNEDEGFHYFFKDTSVREHFLTKKKEFFNNYISSGRLKIVYCDYDAKKLFGLIRSIKEENEALGLVCIDYIQLLSNPAEKGKVKSRQEELKAICADMKNCAIDTGLPIVAAAQFNREVQSEDDMKPTRIGEAGDVERIANLILGFWDRNFNEEKENLLCIKVLKGREISAGHEVLLPYDGNAGKIYTEETKVRTEEEKAMYAEDEATFFGEIS